MISKKILIISSAAICSAVSCGAMATNGSLKLSSTGEPSSITQIAVECGQSRSNEAPAIPIPADSSVAVPYFAVKLYGDPTYCDFYRSTSQGRHIGWAEFYVGTNSAHATIVSYQNLDPIHYNLTMVTDSGTPIVVGTPYTSMDITIARQ